MAARLEYTAHSSDNGKTAEKILKSRFWISSTLMKELKYNGKLTLNGRVCRSVDMVSEGDFLCADIEENIDVTDKIKPKKLDFEVLFEDESILVINKPGGLEAHPCLGNYETTLANAVMYYWSKKGEYHNYHIANRLDKDTSGLCVVAKNRYAHSKLSKQLADKSFGRRYTAVVHGIFDEDSGEIELPIARDSESIIGRKVDENGKYAKTLFWIRERVGDCSLADIELKTGRTHQIRVHFSHIGHPLVGDWLYGNGDSEKNLIGRQALHAGYMVFRHPMTDKLLEFEAPLPKDIKQLLTTLKG